MMTWLIAVASIVAYAAVTAYVAPRLANKYAAWHDNEFPGLVRDEPDRYRREAAFMGLAGGFLFPVVLPCIVIYRVSRLILHNAARGMNVRFPSEIAKDGKRDIRERWRDDDLL